MRATSILSNDRSFTSHLHIVAQTFVVREPADDPDRDQNGLDDAHGHRANHQALALTPEHVVERDRGADPGDDLNQAPSSTRSSPLAPMMGTRCD